MPSSPRADTSTGDVKSPVGLDSGRRWVGRPLPRIEDGAVLTGRATYVDGFAPPGLLHAAFLRSPVAAGSIRSLATERARSVQGVIDIVTADDVRGRALLAALDRPFFQVTSMPLLAEDVVRFVGEPIAMVIAETPYAAEDGVEALEPEIEPAQAVASLERGLAEGAPRVHGDLPDNRLIDVTPFEDADVDRAVADDGAVLVDATFTFGRLSAAPMEARACLAEWDAREERLVVHASTQIPHLLRSAIAEVLDIPEGRLRVIAPDVGGGFGQKVVVSREEVLVAAAGWRLRRPVKWIEDRQESLSSGFQGHDQRVRARAAFALDGTLLELEAETASDVGAYSCYPMTAGVEPMMAMREMPGTYRVPRYTGRALAVATNKPPMAPYRGVGRPQAVFTMDRLMDKAARRLGIGRDEIRWRNLIDDDDFPYEGVTGIVYDRGSYRESLRRVLAALDFATWPERQARAREEGRLLGLGFACISESTGFGTSVFGQRGMRVTPGFESADVRMEPTGEVVVSLGVSAHGQGHRTTFAQIVADELGVDHRAVRVVESDTDATPYGWGTFASRSTVVAGGASKRAATALREKVQRLAAHLLEAAPEDVELRDGRAGVRGSPARSIPIADIGTLAYLAAHRLPPGEEPGLAFRATFDPPGTYSNASHGAVVEVDPVTGRVAIERYVVVEDCGVIINPLIVDGQVRGGVAQGIGKALYEQLVHDEAGQCQTASFMDYLLPTATDLPPIEIEHLETPSEHSETGAKGMGEGGTIGAPVTVANAVEDAVAHLGIDIDTLPIAPTALWRALQAARDGHLDSTGDREERGAGDRA